MPGVKAFAGELLDFEFTDGHFDAIIMNNVIEHVWNPVEIITECFRVLKKGGRLVLITPNSHSLGHKLFGVNWRGLEAPRHLFVYNKKSIRNLMVECGFKSYAAFTIPGGSGGKMMLSGSSRYAKSNIPLTAKYDSILWSALLAGERLFDIAGIPFGEWVVMIGRK